MKRPAKQSQNAKREKLVTSFLRNSEMAKLNDTGYYPEKSWKSRVCTNIFDREGKVQIVKGKLEVKCD